tara:strand:+ start:407 stop:628 length:222 start_codon:yes stop_codon:yes gene_type:complete
MTIKFVSPDRKQERKIYTIGREPVIGEQVQVNWKREGESEEERVFDGFSGVVAQIFWNYGQRNNDHTVMILLD